MEGGHESWGAICKETVKGSFLEGDSGAAPGGGGERLRTSGSPVQAEGAAGAEAFRPQRASLRSRLAGATWVQGERLMG